VLMDGDHTADRCFEVTEATLRALFNALARHNVLLEGTILKPNMVVSGKKCAVQAGVQEVAEKTIKVFKRTVPAAVPGIVFLSGGQGDVEATEHLNEMNKTGGLPWQLSFSYGRALQAPPLKTWGGKPENAPAAQKAYAHRARCNGAARSGRYSAAMEKAA